jgi:hypothetical protein
MPEMSPESRDNTGRPNLEAAKEVAEIRALWPRKTAQRHR